MSYRFDRFTEREGRDNRNEVTEELAEVERNRLASRSLWQRIYDLSESDELKEILWALIPMEGDE